MEIREGRGGLPEQGPTGREPTGRGLPEQGPTGRGVTEQGPTGRGVTEQELAGEVAGALERLIGLFRSLSPASGLSLTAAATLATLERSGPGRLTWLAVREGVTQPAMTQLVARLEEAGLVDRIADPDDGRVVQVRITAEGRAVLAGRRAVRAERLAGLLAGLSTDERNALAAALPVMDALANAKRAAPAMATGTGTGTGGRW